MYWTADSAMRAMWSEMDRNATNGELMRFFAEHLQAAYDAGCADTLKTALDEMDTPTGFEQE